MTGAVGQFDPMGESGDLIPPSSTVGMEPTSVFPTCDAAAAPFISVDRRSKDEHLVVGFELLQDGDQLPEPETRQWPLVVPGVALERDYSVSCRFREFVEALPHDISAYAPVQNFHTVDLATGKKDRKMSWMHAPKDYEF